MKFRVIKENWKIKKVLFLSEPMELEECLKLEKQMLPKMPNRGEDTILLKIHSDKGNSFDYASNGGIFIFTHREEWPLSNQ